MAFSSYKYQAGGWSAAGQDDNGQARSNSVQHQEAWANGKYWTDQERISFERVKLTNKEIQQGGNTLVGLDSLIVFTQLPDFPLLNAKVPAGGAAAPVREGHGLFGCEGISAIRLPICGCHCLPK